MNCDKCKLTPEEAIKEFESELEWAELNIYPYISKQKVEADKMAIKALEQKSKTGHWEHSDREYPEDWHCSNCGAIVEDDEQYRHIWNYCYHCGAKMIEPRSESEDKE